MSFRCSNEVGVSLCEVRQDGKRIIDGIRFELPESVQVRSVSGRTDWFNGSEFKLSIDQAEKIYFQLKKSFEFIDRYEHKGRLQIVREGLDCGVS